MAEAFGIAGSAFGTVSLGVQLFKEISQYLDDIEGREEDLKEALSYATNIQLSLNALNVAMSNEPTGDPETKNAIDSCIVSCVSAVNNLLAVVKDLRGPMVSAPSSKASKELCAKLKYPFKKQNMEKLEEILSRTNSALQTTLQVFQLNNSHATTAAINDMHQAMANVHLISNNNKSTLDEIQKTSELHNDRLSTLQRDVRELLILTRDSQDSNILLRTLAQHMSDHTSHTSVTANLLQNPTSDTFLPSVQTTSYQGGYNMTFDAFCSCKTQRSRFSQTRWGPFLLEVEISSRDHHAPECPMSKLSAATHQTKRVLNLSLPTSLKLPGRASRFSLSFTTGAGILGLSQLTWVATVDEDSSPVFRIVRMMEKYNRLPRKDMHILLASCLRRLVWCYVNSHAAVTDVNKNGDSIIEWALEHYQFSSSLAALNPDNMADLFQMLSVVTKPATYPRRVTVAPIPALLARSNWFSKCTRPNQVATALLSNYNESVGHCHRDWALSWWRGNGFVRGSYTLFQSFPQVAEKFGPLSQAILKQDRDGVQQLLKRYPSYINEIDYCGQSPIHLAIETQNMDILGVILLYSNTEALNVKDNMGRNPIAPATAAIGTHTERIQESCGGFKVLETLISQYQWIYMAIVRYYTFALLELPHVCCCIIQNPSGPLPEDERRELQEEESFQLELFENLIAEFEEKCLHEMRLEGFFEWMRLVWVPRMCQAEQELASLSLTSQQLQDVKAIGVILEFDGPLPVDSSPRVVEGLEDDLWDAMDELDQIATDPERPTKESLQTHT
ncbi:hypothetical protein FPRO05_11162 [Fusarium proliferatum]|uniref:Uncharacterized protein n=1 Tax=Gibberella intermedia TaxID=948311 RepID=A0A365NBS3_GIBIN|nr:hypothetical protein FPRO05_11162 [Fusarium proliferatum]